MLFTVFRAFQVFFRICTVLLSLYSSFFEASVFVVRMLLSRFFCGSVFWSAFFFFWQKQHKDTNDTATDRDEHNRSHSFTSRTTVTRSCQNLSRPLIWKVTSVRLASWKSTAHLSMPLLPIQLQRYRQRGHRKLVMFRQLVC